jgi:hypothetical protein
MAYFLSDYRESFNLNAMKTSFLKLESLILIFGLFLIPFSVSSQNVKMSRQEKKEAKREKRYLNFQALDTLIQSQTFILKADFLQNEYGSRIPVLSDLNFIKVDVSNAVIQTGSSSNFGYNGVGGATAEGSIRGLKVVKNLKNLIFYIRFTVVTEIGIYDVDMTINSDGSARATLSGLSRGKLVYDGRIGSIHNSGFFKGLNSI